jgi:GNAT superfamily N-acetyltransferase
MVSFEIRPLLPTDTLSLVKLHYRAFGNSISPILFSAAPSESCYETMAGERARILAKPDIKGFQAVSPAGEMIGAAYFHIAPNGVPQEQLDSEEPMWRTFAAAQVVDLWKAWGKCMGDRYKETVGTRACVEVLMLIVDPEAQGKGVGSRLLELGCQEADRFVLLLG